MNESLIAPVAGLLIVSGIPGILMRVVFLILMSAAAEVTNVSVKKNAQVTNSDLFIFYSFWALVSTDYSKTIESFCLLSVYAQVRKESAQSRTKRCVSVTAV